MGDPCVFAPIATYEAPGFSCTVGNFSFSGITVTGPVTALKDATFSPENILFNGVLESGLALSYNLAAGPGESADVSWLYTVTAVTGFITDAYLDFNATVTGSGTATITEDLSNGVHLFLLAPNTGPTTATFNPVTELFTHKDQNDFVPGQGTSTSSVMINAFSSVPGPIVGAGLPGLVAACGGLLALARRRRRLCA
jgi:hypothetical protein